MTPADFIRLVARITYKPGWSVTAVDDPELQAVRLRVAFTVPDATGARTDLMPLRIKYLIPHHAILHRRDMDEAAALALVSAKIMEMERHEHREWFKLDGQAVYPAHGPNGELL